MGIDVLITVIWIPDLMLSIKSLSGCDMDALVTSSNA